MTPKIEEGLTIDLKKEIINKSYEWLKNNFLEDKYWYYRPFDFYAYLHDFKKFMEDEL